MLGCISRASPFLADEVLRRWPAASFAICDRFRLPELLDAFAGRVRIFPRVTQWSEASADIRALRSLALDGELSVHPVARALLRVSLAAASVQNDTLREFTAHKIWLESNGPR